MKSNMGSADKIVRVLLALLAAVLYFTGITSGTLGIALMVIGTVLLITSFLNFCPLYTIFGISTRYKK
jgi:uncharacterized membrane protein YtjA (UPF0391 family)